MHNILSEFICGDMLIIYVHDEETGTIGLELIPSALKQDVMEKHHAAVDPCVHLKLVGDDYPNGFSQGRSMRNAQTTKLFQLDSQHKEENDQCLTVITLLRDDQDHMVEHHLMWHKRYAAIEVKTVFRNHSQDRTTLEMLTSFSLGGLTPFSLDDAQGKLKLHRLRSTWSMEGRLESMPIEELQLEPSWQNYSANSLRFGQVGSMPVRGYFPFVAVEDTSKKVTWAVQLAYAGSWQMEAYRRDHALCISGGLADREFGHWLKHVQSGHTFTTPSTFLTVVEGGVDEASQRLTAMHELPLSKMPETEHQLPIVFNEFCTTWGNPSADNIMAIAERIQGKGIEYLVIDCGWYSEGGKSWESNMGDWVPNPALFPQGLEHVLQYIRSCGMTPGIWFEIEICGRDAAAFHFTDHLLKRDGVPITSGNRRFWDLRDPWTIQYLTDKVIGMIKQYGFGYLKIDYNDTLGIGCDGAESLGEGLREQIEAVQQFICRINEEVPQLVIENCSSGGHRLEPSMMAITSISSFSDAHEELEIPIIAANLHRAILPRQSQIWAVLRKEDTARRLVYSIASTFLGRMCLSGDIHELDPEQWALIDKGIQFYNRVTPVIRDGITTRFGPEVLSYRHPEGWQAICRVNKEQSNALIVIHMFDVKRPESIRIPIPKTFKLVSSYSETPVEAIIHNHVFEVAIKESFQAMAFYLEQS